jgi:glutathione S-transferase
VHARLYSLKVSNPGHAARLMLAHKGIETQVIDLLPGLHPVALWARGYRRGTVPVLKLDGRRIEGSLEIARALEAAVPEPPLFPAEPERRRAVEEAEAWGERELQNVPRRIFRHASVVDHRVRVWLAADSGLPLPAVSGRLAWPVARALAGRVGANDAQVRVELANLRSTLDRVDALIATGVISTDEPNVADFQIASTVRLLGAFRDLDPIVHGRPCDAHARRYLPDFPQIPAILSPELLAVAGL